jgi:hypothetical protein
MRIALPLFLFLCLFSGASPAASPEDAYLAARDKYIAQFRVMEKAKANSEKIDAAHTKALADLEERLRVLVGEVAVKGFSGAGKINLESLTESDVGYGMLDGMVYSPGSEDGPQLVVTTRYLLDKWLATAAKKDKSSRVPADLRSALQLDQFYTFSIGSDAAFTRDANLEITVPPGAELARAVLGGWAQDIGPNTDHSLIVTVVKDGKVFIGSIRPKTAVGEIAACQTIWTEAQHKAEKLRAAREAAARGKNVVDASDDKTEEKADRDFHACFVQRAPKERFYPSLVEEAQQVADRIAGK